MRARRQADRDGSALVHLVDDARVVLRECDVVRHTFGSLLLVQPGDLAPAPHRRPLVRGRAHIRQTRGTRLGGCGGTLVEQPRLRRLQLLDVIVVVGKEGASRLDVADAGELQLEPDSLLVTLAAELFHLGTQFLGALGRFGRLSDLALELGDLGVALGEGRFVALARLLERVASFVVCLGFARQRCLLLRRLLLRGLVALRCLLTRALRLNARAIVLTVHVGLPFKSGRA